MSSIRGKNTKPEITIRRLIWSKGARYRIHDKTVFGCPDISNKSKRMAIFVDGCFWHGCHICYKEPKTNTVFWRNKIQRNKKRRSEVKKTLKIQGWKIMEVWEHQINKNPHALADKIVNRFSEC